MRTVSAPRTLWFNCFRSITDSYDRKAWLKSCRYLRRPLGSLILISRSTPARACNCASLRRSRKLEVDAMPPFLSPLGACSTSAAYPGLAPWATLLAATRLVYVALTSSLRAPYAPMFKRRSGVQLAQLPAAEPYCRHHRIQRIDLP